MEKAFEYAKEVLPLYEETFGAEELENKLKLPSQALVLDLSAKIMLQSIVEKNSFEKAYSFLSDTFSNQLIEVRTRFGQGHEGFFKVTEENVSGVSF